MQGGGGAVQRKEVSAPPPPVSYRSTAGNRDQSRHSPEQTGEKLIHFSAHTHTHTHTHTHSQGAGLRLSGGAGLRLSGGAGLRLRGGGAQTQRGAGLRLRGGGAQTQGGGGGSDSGGAGLYLQTACVGLEPPRRVLRGDAALDGAAVDADVVLLQTELSQAAALAYVQLCVNQVHTERGAHSINHNHSINTQPEH